MDGLLQNRIEKKIILNAPLSRVWKAIAGSEQFGTWFLVKFDEPFVEGRTIAGRITHPGYEHLTMEIQVVRIHPETDFAYRWHPYAVNPAVDYSSEPTTLVEFHLEPAGEGTLLTIVESGFESIPAARRAEAFKMNDGGWAAQTRNIADYLARLDRESGVAGA